MELARDIQKVFYNEQTSNDQSYREMSTPTSKLSNGSTVLRNLPTLTTNDGIKGADTTALLPGYQFVWTVSHPQHCHMFHQLLAGSAPWYFGHIYLSANNLQKDDDENSIHTIDDIQSYNDIQQQLKSEGSTLYGTLLRVTDRIFQDEDGHIVLAVQAIEKFKVHSVASLPGTSLRTDVQISPDRELIQSFFDKALLSSASYLSDVSDEGSSSQVLSSPSAINGAARAAAVAYSNRMRKFDYHPIFLEKKPTVQSRLQSNPNDSNAKKLIKDAIKKKEEQKSGGAEYVSVVQLANFCAFEFASLSKSDTVTSQALKTYWEHMAKEQSSQGMNTDEEDMFSDSSSSSSTSFFLPELAPTSQPPASAEEIEMKEKQLWVSLDDMIRLLSMAASSTVPLPSQLLGLLPKRDDWPKYFQLEEYANRFKGNTVGTAFQSPFVRVDQITCSNSSLSYSPLRRANRLSYAIWLLLDGLSMTGAEPAPPPRHLLLEMDIAQRLDAAKDTLEGINTILKRMLPEKKDDDEKK